MEGKRAPPKVSERAALGRPQQAECLHMRFERANHVQAVSEQGMRLNIRKGDACGPGARRSRVTCVPKASRPMRQDALSVIADHRSEDQFRCSRAYFAEAM